MVLHIDTVIPFSRKYSGKTIREIIRFDSGYLKDLFKKDERLCFSEECFADICRLTAGHKDNWEKPSYPTSNIFHQIKPYGTPYLYDFNDEELIALNKLRIRYK